MPGAAVFLLLTGGTPPPGPTAGTGGRVRIGLGGMHLLGGYGAVTALLPDTLEAAVKQFYTANNPLSAAFGASIYAGRRPAGSPAAPYLIVDCATSPGVLFTSTSTVRATRLSFTTYATTRAEAKAKGQLVYDQFKGAKLPYKNVRCAPLVVSNRSAYEAPGLGVGGAMLFCDRVDWLCREQQAR